MKRDPRMSFGFPPRLMKAPAAAYYLGISLSKFYAMAIPSKQHNGNTLWDIRDLDEYADELTYKESNACKTRPEVAEPDIDVDAVFGVVRRS